jgi:hypothetical protein
MDADHDYATVISDAERMIGRAKAGTEAPEDPARAALARLVEAHYRKGRAPMSMREDLLSMKEWDAALAEAERALEEPERDWKAEARYDWSERALEASR